MVNSPVLIRLRAVMTSLNNYVIQNGDGGFAKFAFLMQALTDEVIEELEEKDEELIQAYMTQMGEVIAWIGHGDDSKLPETLRALSASNQLEPAEA